MEVLTAILVILIFFLLYCSKPILNAWRILRMASKLPTNKPHPLFGHLFYFLVPQNRLLNQFLHLPKINEPLFTVWLGPVPFLLLFKPQHLEALLGNVKYINKDFPYTFVRNWVGDGLISIQGGEKWQSHRKMLTSTFHFSIMENFVDVFANKSQILVKKLEREIGAKEFDIHHYIFKCTLDIICETAMGTDMRLQDHDEHLDYFEAIHSFFQDGMVRVLLPWLYPDFLYNLTSAGRRSKAYIETLQSFSNKVIHKKKEEYKRKTEGSFHDEKVTVKSKKLAFLDLLLENNALTDTEMREEVDTFIAAGHDTVSVSLNWTLQMLASHPEFQEKVYEELESIFQGSDRSPTMTDLNQMKYLEMVINESLRLYPSAPLIARTPMEDIQIDGMTIPAGLTILVLLAAAQRDPELYPDPDTFNPDRFLPENIVKRHPYAHIPFSAGPRNCIGRRFAMLEMKTIISYVLQHYKLEATRKIPAAILNVTLKPENGVHLKITPRN